MWKGGPRRSSQFASVSCRSRLSGSTRTPMEEISKARPSTSFHIRMSPFSSQSS